MTRPVFTHVAIYCADIDRSAAFYADHVGLAEVHRRVEHDVTVVWMGEEARPGEFVVVLLGLPVPPGTGPFAHLGYAVGSRAEVDAAAAKGRAAGIEVEGPVEGGPVVGYYCMLSDPDGNQVEFSFGQALGPHAAG